MDQDDDDGSETNYLGTSKGGLRNGVLKKAFFVILYNRKIENHPISRIGFLRNRQNSTFLAFLLNFCPLKYVNEARFARIIE